MDSISQRACIARFDEPTFYENDVSWLKCQFFIQTPLADEYETESIMESIHHDEDYAGSLTQANFDGTLSGAQDPTCVRLKLRLTAEQLNLASAQTVLSPAQSSFSQSLSNLLLSRHPSPEREEDHTEQDIRGTRSALDGPDTIENAHFAALLTPELVARSTNASNGLERPETSRVIARSLPNLTALATARTHSRPGLQDRDLAYASYIYVSEDQDSLSVDDPRRNYDFAAFMEQWKAKPFHYRKAPHLPLSSWQLRNEVCRSDIAVSDCDMQGIRWADIGTDRSIALQARKALHPVECPYNMSSMRKEALLAYSPVSQEENIYQFRNFNSRHRAQISHYQLRNVLAATNHSDIFYAQGSSVVQTSGACRSKMTTVMNLKKPDNSAASFRITCLATSPQLSFSQYKSNNILLAGGFNGEYAFLNLNDPSCTLPTEGFVTHSYNGLVTHVHTFASRYSGIPQATFCTNDANVRLLDLATFSFTNTFSYNHAMNSASTSPDGRLRVLAGDSTDLLLTSAEDGSVITILNGHTDHCFATAWSSVNGGHNVATASQDGMTCIWDTRNWSTPLHRLRSAMSCARSLQFADDDGSLVMAENDDVVTVYDPLMPTSKKQHIRFFGAIAGIALPSGGRELIIANSDQTVGGLMTFSKMKPYNYVQTLSEGAGRTWNRMGPCAPSAGALDLVSECMV
ncbi:Hypothetical protein R9X50_00521200 [Acrodontium crateriforme]|uniref:WD40 repeat-like protein n=1 Tax=Acrodontium crateriforme TaxID=150365 RepID=A0AAQ3M6Q6_9PEZI|nr:Hypothetical protein R9X50_00521200 [Acrodontium crateriforme]